MSSSDEEFLVRLLAALDSTQLEALIVGTMAAVLQGAPVMTQDVDLLVRDTPLDRTKLDALGSALGAAKPIPVSELSSVLTIVGADVPVDILFDSLAGGLSFASLRSRGVELKLGNRTARVAHLSDVIASKEAADRPKDRAQLPILRDTLKVLQFLA